jgi:hypothetical protein
MGYNPMNQYKKELKSWKRWSRWFDMGPPPSPPSIARASFGHEVVENWRIRCHFMYAAACEEYLLQGKGKCVQAPSPLDTWKLYDTVGPTVRHWPDVCCSRIPSATRAMAR